MWQSKVFFHSNTADEKPLLAISACLTGQAVRYDGRAKYHRSITDWISPTCRMQALCPEVDAGLAIPRPPVQLVREGRTIKALGREDSHLDVSEQLQSYAQKCLHTLPSNLSGIILKSRSPSCGINSTPIYAPSGDEIELGSGIFSQHAQIQRPWLAFAQESELQTKQQCLVYLWRIFLNHDILKARDHATVRAAGKHYQRLLGRSVNLETLGSESPDPPYRHSYQHLSRSLRQQLQQAFSGISQDLATDFLNRILKEPQQI